MQRTPKFSPKTRAILTAITRKPLTVAEICAQTGLPPKEVHPRIQNAVRSGYAVVTGEPAIQGARTARRYSAVETPEHIEPFKASDGRFDFSELLRQVGPSTIGLPSGKARLVRKLGDDETSQEFESSL
jgi:hypothetical protein